MTTKPPDDLERALIAIAYSVPAHHVNHIHTVFINGLYRVTFMECQSAPDGSLIITSPRCSVILTPGFADEFLRVMSEYMKSTEASVMPMGTMQ